MNDFDLHGAAALEEDSDAYIEDIKLELEELDLFS